MAVAIMTKTFFNLRIFGARYQKNNTWLLKNQDISRAAKKPILN